MALIVLLNAVLVDSQDMVSCYDDLVCASGPSTMSTIHDCWTIALIHLVWDIECRDLVIALPAPKVRAEKVLFVWHNWGGMYGVGLLIMYHVCHFLVHGWKLVISILPVIF